MELSGYLTLFAMMVNSIAIIILIFKHFHDISKDKREKERTNLEIQQLKAKLKESESRVTLPSSDEIDEIAIKPFIKTINETLTELRSVSTKMKESITVLHYLIESIQRSIEKSKYTDHLLEQINRSIQISNDNNLQIIEKIRDTIYIFGCDFGNLNKNQNLMLLENINTLNKIWEQNAEILDSLKNTINAERSKINQLEKIINSLKDLMKILRSKIIGS